MCQVQLGWDENMGDKEAARWRKWLEQLPKLSRFKLPRSLVPISFGSVISYQLHHFADAKLTAATVAARMDCKLQKELGLKLEDSVFWTDSTSVLKYLFNQKARYHTFVANRVNLIRELSSASAWRYVDTKSNPADLASRGLDVDTFLTSEMWIRGPRFLHEPESSWPQVPEDVKHGSLEDDVEVKVSVMPDGRVQASSKIVRLRPFLQDGLLRVGGGLRHSGRHFNATHPIILPNKSSLVKLMVRGASREVSSLRGPVKSIRSDNGTNLVGAEKVLRQELQLLDQTAICDTKSTRGISWCFNPPHASHFGGVWERQIRSIRRVLSGICYQQTLTDDSLHTLLCEVEAIINGRPLTRVTDDPDCLQPLTPSMLLNLKGSPGPVMNTDNKNLYARRRWKQVQYLADLFWKRWSKEYLPLLQERQKWNIKRRDVKKGDIVLALDERLPRGTWPLARVIEVMCDSDGHVRSAKLKTVSGEYIRPISKMCLLLETPSLPTSFASFRMSVSHHRDRLILRPDLTPLRIVSSVLTCPVSPVVLRFFSPPDLTSLRFRSPVLTCPVFPEKSRC
ncbi:uncharacterized protein [Penaeus vannamei]|uniref:uncharacterized protein n=1 Tax=Penaeus vannamei TaxID=6689 RepID=UPI00387FB0BE